MSVIGGARQSQGHQPHGRKTLSGGLALSLGSVFFSIIMSPITTPIAFHVFGEMASEEYERVLQG